MPEQEPTQAQPEPLYVDGWTYYPQPQALPEPPPAPVRPQRRPIGMFVALGCAVVVLIGAGVTSVIMTRGDDEQSKPDTTAADTAQIESAMRRFLQITSADDPAYPEVACAAFREKYRSRRKTDVAVYRPEVKSVDRIRITGDSATAHVRAVIRGKEEDKVFDLKREDGKWKACTLEPR
ncbi:nuclear transport factor 2 family protein [Nocardia sp. NPDC052566]|uniref:Rv0361 family membrane protein n=1 Tax=Nocardia sp. NPDC052566 TaxID=3364330 RepID=UPI0037C8F4C0